MLFRRGFQLINRFPVFEHTKCSDTREEKISLHVFFSNIRNCINQVLPCLVYYPVTFHECTSLSEGCYGELQTGFLLLRHL